MRQLLLRPWLVALVILLAAALASFIWAATYVSSVSSNASHGPPGNRAAGPAASPPATPPPPSSPAAVAAVLAKVHGAVWAVHTLDANGEPSTGSAFAVQSSSDQTLLLTSYSVVATATYQPAPPIQVNQGGGPQQPVTLRDWDPGHDLALLVLADGNQPVLQGSAVAPRAGQPVYAVSGLGGPDGSAAAGQVVAASGQVLEDTATQGSSARGGPLVDINGSVLGVDSQAFVPPAATAPPAGTHAAVPVQDSCAALLVCPGGTFPTG